jgi:hypothetical protein
MLSRSRPQTLAEFYKDSYVPMVRLAILLTGSTEVAHGSLVGLPAHTVASCQPSRGSLW